MLNGKKTYVVAGGSVLLGVALFLGWVELDTEQAEALLAILAGLGAAAMRSGVAKAGEVAAEVKDSE